MVAAVDPLSKLYPSTIRTLSELYPNAIRPLSNLYQNSIRTLSFKEGTQKGFGKNSAFPVSHGIIIYVT